MPTLIGEVKRVTFENEETGFRVVKVSQKSGATLALVGIFQAVGPGQTVRATGNFAEDLRHGRQFRADSVIVLAPEGLGAIEKYLGSGAISGLGPGFAKRIVQTFGVNTLKVLDEDVSRLATVPGLKGKRLDALAQSWSKQRRLSNIHLLLQTHGASLGLAKRIIEKYDDRAAQMLERHPYRLALEIRGIGFNTADRLARSLGLSQDHPERVQAGIVHQLELQAASGHVRNRREQLVQQTVELLGVADDHIQAGIDALWAAERVVVEGDAVYSRLLFEAEQSVTADLARLVTRKGLVLDGWQQAVNAFEKTVGYPLSDEQRDCVKSAALHKVLVITGGPGVGKTTQVRAILRVLEAAHLTVSLAAPTGRAAKRLSESTGRGASTLHRLLEYDPRTNDFQRNAECPLQAGAVVVDEASMLDIRLAQSLFSAIPDNGRLILVGDVDQLPSVGPGAVLKDVIDSKVVPTARLTRIFRQAEASSIVHNAHAILEGRAPVSDPPSSKHAEFFLIERTDAGAAAEVVRQLVSRRIPDKFRLHPIRDIQVLTPMHRGPAGTTSLNRLLQKSLNPSSMGLEYKGERFRIGDKVMQIRNDYDKEAFNGDLGQVAQVDADGPRMVVQFDKRQVTYVGRDLDSLVLAYATTIHKSQGSEYPAVVIPLSTSHFPMLSRNLLYTAVTRAKRLCVLVADPRALKIALGELRREQRATGLEECLQQSLDAPGGLGL